MPGAQPGAEMPPYSVRQPCRRRPGGRLQLNDEKRGVCSRLCPLAKYGQALVQGARFFAAALGAAPRLGVAAVDQKIANEWKADDYGQRARQGPAEVVLGAHSTDASSQPASGRCCLLLHAGLLHALHR